MDCKHKKKIILGDERIECLPVIDKKIYAGGHYIGFDRCFCMDCGIVFLDYESCVESKWIGYPEYWEYTDISAKDAKLKLSNRKIMNKYCDKCGQRID